MKLMIQIGAPPSTLDAPVQHLTACHRRIEQRLDTLVHAAGLLATDRARALDAIASSMRFLDSNGVMHTEDEEASLFPRLRPKLSPDELAFVEALERQHGEAASIYAQLGKLVERAAELPEVPPDLIEQYGSCAEQLRALYRAHIQSEDDILSPLALRYLSDTELTAISAEMRRRRGL